jgi:hypothetical protein
MGLGPLKRCMGCRQVELWEEVRGRKSPAAQKNGRAAGAGNGAAERLAVTRGWRKRRD